MTGLWATEWFVVCDDWTAGPFGSEKEASDEIESILKIGACCLPHRVEHN